LVVLDKYSHVTLSSLQYASYNLAEKDSESKASIGVTVTTNGVTAEIVKIVPGSPAQKYLQTGDHIIAVGGISTRGMSAKSIVQKFVGAPNSIVPITVERDGQTINYQIARMDLTPQPFDYEIQNGILSLRIQKFTTGMAQKITTVLWDTSSNIKGVLLDLRGNRGGVLEEATAIADLFLAGGQMISMRGRHPNSNFDYRVQNKSRTYDGPVVILIDGYTASASEVLAAALQHNNRAVVVGTNSYGKGAVQRAVYIEGLGQIAITWSKLYLDAKGSESLDGVGVNPTVCTAALDQWNQDPDHSKPEPARVLTWFRRAPQITWDSRNCPKQARRDRSEDKQLAISLVQDSGLYNKLLNKNDI